MNASSQQLNLEYRPSTADLRQAAIRRIVSRFWQDFMWCFVGGAFMNGILVYNRVFVPNPLVFQACVIAALYVISFLTSAAIAFADASKNAGQPHAIVVEVDGITEISPGVRRFFAWGSIKKVIPSGGGLLITPANLGDWIVPDGAFRDRADRDGFLHAVNGVRNGYGLPVSGGSSAVWPPPPGT